MDNKLSELSKPTACRNKHTGRTFNATENTEPQIYESLYSQEYVSDLRADAAKWFEAFKKAVSVGARYEERIAELNSTIERWATDRAESAQCIVELQAKLATPVRFPDCDIAAVSHMAHWLSDEEAKAWVKGVEFAKQQVRAAGFTVGDE